MTIDLKTFLTQTEGSAKIAYKDASGMSIGVGHFLTANELASGIIDLPSGPAEWKNGLNDEQINELLDKDIAKVRLELAPLLGAITLTEGQMDALTDFVFNVGIGAFSSSTAFKYIRQGQFDRVPGELMKWVLSEGHVVPGLVNRRLAEGKMWNGS